MASSDAPPLQAGAGGNNQHHLEPGRTLAGRYELQQRLGDGGHAEVWAARDHHDGSLVALKFMHLRSCSPGEALAVLGHEARMAQRLQHPGVLAVGEPQSEGQLVFLPIQYAAGGDASALRGAPWQRVLPVLLDVAEILEHAHSRGVVHRDIKAGNVLFDADGTVRLTDFGASALTGCTDAYAPGSPFSASPRQLRGEAATTADDVYGLGALAHELLTRYPPFYPNFDARRVQEQEPPRPVPVHPAPAALLDLVQAMLLRDAAGRPDIAGVIAGFQQCLENGEAQMEGAGLVLESQARAPEKPATRRLPGPGWWLFGATAAAAAGLLIWLPGTPGADPVLVVDDVPPAVSRVADAVIAPPAPAVEAPVATAPVSLADELSAGEAALRSGQPAIARAAFQRALALQSDHAGALDGLAAADALDALLAQLAEGTRAEARGDLAAAASSYQAALARRAGFEPARESLARVRRLQRERELEDLLAAGAEALRSGRVADAGKAYERAAALDAEEPRVRDGQARVQEVLLDQRNARDLAVGAELERAERWQDALAHYQDVKSRDAELKFAQDGLTRSSRRAALDEELEDYLARPERLTAAPVRRAAELALARGEASSAAAPRLQSQLVKLRAELGKLQVQVPVALTSDNSTRVSLTQVGELGSFTERELQLPPGRYTFIGRREGFRDVRQELEITPGQRAASLSVQCTERI